MVERVTRKLMFFRIGGDDLFGFEIEIGTIGIGDIEDIFEGLGRFDVAKS
jgi:hypothetical protein